MAMKSKIDPQKWRTLLAKHTKTEIAETLGVTSGRITQITDDVEAGHEFNPFTVGEYERRLKTKLELSPTPVEPNGSTAGGRRWPT